MQITIHLNTLLYSVCFILARSMHQCIQINLFLLILFPDHFTLTQASRDAVAKTLYDRVFRWVVRQVNQLLAPTSEDSDRASEIG